MDHNIQNVQSFSNTEFGELEVIQDGDKFWFPATKCAKILGYSNPRKAILDHCKSGGVTKRDVPTSGLNQYGARFELEKTVNYISEGNLYRLISRSKLESAERFESWVFDEVIPTIRKHGAYIVPDLLDALNKNEAERQRLLDDLTADRKAMEQLAGKNEILQSALTEARPKVSYYDMILQNPYAMPVTLIAKDYGDSAVHFNKMLKKFGIQYKVGKTWALYQDYADLGYVHYNVYRRGDKAKSHMCWTQKGRLFLYNFLKGKGIIPMIERQGMQVRMEEKINGDSNIQED